MPSLRDEAAWTVAGSVMEARAAVTVVVAMHLPGTEDGDVQKLARMVAQRGYSQAELAFAASELLYDAVLSKRLQFPDVRIVPADFERVIVEHRRMRRQLTMMLREIDMNRLVMDYPSHLSLEDFGVCGFDSFDQPLYRFAQSGPLDAPPKPCPRIDADERPGSDRTREGGDFGPV